MKFNKVLKNVGSKFVPFNKSKGGKLSATSSPKANAQDYAKLADLAYKKHAGEINKNIPDGYKLDEELSTRETKVFYNPDSKKTVVSYRGTDLKDPKRALKDIKSDFHILTGRENKDKRFKQATKDFSKIDNKYKSQGYSVDTTGHSLGGQLATHVNKQHKGKVSENLSFSRGAGVFEPFRKRPKNTYDYSHKKDIISMGARMSRDEGGGSSRSNVSNTKVNNPLQAHNINSLNLGTI
jgi:hypothetical protein